MSDVQQDPGRQAAEGSFSPELRAIYTEARPWLEAQWAASPFSQGHFPEWELDLDQRVIWFGDEERRGLVAAVEIIGTHSAEDGVFLWAWSNPKLSAYGKGVDQVREQCAEVPEFTTPTVSCDEPRAMSLATAAAFKMGCAGCLRLPAQIHTYVALYDITVLPADDPRAVRPRTDETRARDALAGYAGPAAVELGAMLVAALEEASASTLELDSVVAATHALCDNLQALSESPVGKGTDAAHEALQVAATLRQGALLLAAAPMAEAFREGVLEFLSLLTDIARHYGAWTAVQDASTTTPSASC